MRILILVFAIFGLSIQQANAQQPNVIVIISDDAGYADFEPMDGLSGETSEIPTPNLLALANVGVRFSRAYVAQSCQPTRAAIVTGAYQNRMGNEVVGNNLTTTLPDGSFEGLQLDADTVWERMKDLGYTTGYVGKWHLGAAADQGGNPGNRPQHHGIDEFYGILDGSRTYVVGNTGLGETRVLRETIVSSGGSVSDVVVEAQHSGEYITNTFGDYAVDFIANHYNDGSPFCLFQSFTAPHTPLQDSPDINDPRLAGLTGTRKTYGSMMLTMDLEIGRMIDRLNDPNGDGNTSDSIADDTLIIFVNDNGGADENSSSPNGADNGHFRRGKGSPWEGGIRVPMIMAGAGVTAVNTVYDEPVHGIDILPTLVEAGGGTIDPLDSKVDGVNLVPFVNGTATGVPHDILVHRHRSHFSIIQGDWKLTWSGGSPPASVGQLFNLANDISETSNVASQNSARVTEMRRLLTDFEVEFDKQRYAILNQGQNTINLFDHFVYNPASSASFSSTNAWWEAGTNTSETMLISDPFAGQIIEFPTSSNGYTSTNDMVSRTGVEFMLNNVVLSGDYNSSQSSVATIQGNELLFVNSLFGVPAELTIDANNSGSGQFDFQIDTGLLLHSGLLIDGDGSVDVTIGGPIQDYDPTRPSSLTKRGNSSVSLTAGNTYTGDTFIEDGTLVLSGGATLGTSMIEIQSSGTFDVTSGGFNLGSGQTIAGNGIVDGDLTAGNDSTVNPTGQLDITGSYTHQAGATLLVEVGVTSNDVLNVGGDIAVNGGDLLITLETGYVPQDGDSIDVLDFASFSGAFGNVQLPELSGGLSWNITALASTGVVTVGFGTSTTTTTIIGGQVGNADFEATEPFSGPQWYSDTPNWFNASGSEGINFTNDSQTNGSSQASSRAGMPFQNRVQINDTGYVVQAEGEVFSLSYDFGAGGAVGNWDGNETMRTFLFTSVSGANGNTVGADMTELGSDSYQIDRANDGQWTSYSAANLYTTTAADVGQTVYFGMEFLDGSGPTLFPRIDVLVLQVTTPGTTLTVVTADTLNVTRGVLAAGGVTELAESDNADFSIRRSTTDVQSRTEFTAKAVSPYASPSLFEITVEGSVFARTNVNQIIELFDYDSGTWEQIDIRLASRFIDNVVTVEPTGDLARFVEPGTNCIQARVRFQSVNPRQQFTSNTDQFLWAIQ